jgi:hypothetical protein
MQTMAQLRELHDRMMSDLASLPKYKALKAMDRLIGEMSLIYASDAVSSERNAETLQQRVNAAIESRAASDLIPNAPSRVSAYVPGERVA